MAEGMMNNKIRVSGRRWTFAALLGATALTLPVGAWAAEDADALPKKSKAALSDTYIPLAGQDVVGQRTAPIVEIGNPFLGTGRLSEPVEIFTGAVWTPSIQIFGSYRAAIQGVDDERGKPYVELVNRLDLFGNLQLSGTERILVGFTPLNDGGKFTRYVVAGGDEGFHSEHGAHLTAAFAEFQVDQVFPFLDPWGGGFLDVNVAAGRQLIEAQDGMLVNDTMDSVGVAKNNIQLPGNIHGRVTGVMAWNEVHRGNNVFDGDALFYGLFTSWDTSKTTYDLDFAYVDGQAGRVGDSIHAGLSATRRFGLWNASGRIMGSTALDGDSAGADDGVLSYVETSTSFPGDENIFYANGFWGVGSFTSASRAGTAGGPLVRTGILFSSANLGAYGAPLNNRGQNVVGGAVGYQMFLSGVDQQLTFELGGVADTVGNDRSGVGFGTSYSRKLTDRVVFRADGYVAHNQDDRGTGYGLRSEIQVLF
ncbi:MAG: hypothetical protein K9H25_14940 [Rhodospirillum sp.]|nr:hypothetical protein [Rhodospirillum sp.]MCF8492070.1 hypothetical protein [Rhodospirillum sp.]MCF8502073.1 hypothetical protein [Rhodospirillum sp.]